jgi:Recombinase
MISIVRTPDFIALGLANFGGVFSYVCSARKRMGSVLRRGYPMEKDYLILKRASASRPSGQWNDDDFDVLTDSVVVGRIFKANASPVGVKEIQASGVSSLRGVARALTARGVRTARGGDWTAVQVSDILRR